MTLEIRLQAYAPRGMVKPRICLQIPWIVGEKILLLLLLLLALILGPLACKVLPVLN
jgi:hypothetical protein